MKIKNSPLSVYISIYIKWSKLNDFYEIAGQKLTNPNSLLKTKKKGTHVDDMQKPKYNVKSQDMSAPAL